MRNVKEDVVRLNEWAAESAGVMAKLENGLNRQAQADLKNNLVITGLSKTVQPADAFGS